MHITIVALLRWIEFYTYIKHFLYIETAAFYEKKIKVSQVFHFIQCSRSKNSDSVLLFHHIWNNGINKFEYQY